MQECDIVLPYDDLYKLRRGALVEDMKNVVHVLPPDHSITCPLNVAGIYVFKVVTREGMPY